MKRITLNENTLHKIIKESVIRILREEEKHLQGAKPLSDVKSLGGPLATGKGRGKHLAGKPFDGKEFEKNADEWCKKHNCKRIPASKENIDEMTSKDFDDDFETSLRDKKYDDKLSTRHFNQEFDDSLSKAKSDKGYRDYQVKNFNRGFKK